QALIAALQTLTNLGHVTRIINILGLAIDLALVKVDSSTFKGVENLASAVNPMSIRLQTSQAFFGVAFGLFVLQSFSKAIRNGDTTNVIKTGYFENVHLVEVHRTVNRNTGEVHSALKVEDETIAISGFVGDFKVTKFVLH
ncbi:UNVERIFIED_CONTAM: hypothetical protein HDU68_006110, partial [Siphonaria sp. JEL0065]